MKVSLISKDKKYKLIRFSEGVIYDATLLLDHKFTGYELATIINDVCIVKVVNLKDFKICNEN